LATLCACATANKDALPAPVKVDAAALRTCESILKDVALPALKADDDARAAFMKDDAALIEASGRLKSGRGCVADVRKRYAGEPAKAEKTP
jgi:hypothetical protein